MKKAQITVIIPTYKRPRLLKRAVNSVLLQSYKDILIYILDNASGDETEDVVKKYIETDDRVVYIKNEKNIGGVKNMEKGVSLVRTPFYSLLNDDDFILPGFYESAMSAINEFPSVGFVCTKTITIDIVNNKWGRRNLDWEGGFYESTSETINKMYNSHFTQTGVIIRNSLKNEIGLFEASGDDRLYMTMAAAASSFFVIDSYGAAYIIHDQSFSSMVGLRKEKISVLMNQFLLTIQICAKLDVPVKNKSHLILLIVKAYNDSFERYQVGMIENGTSFDCIELLPSLTEKTGVFLKIYGKSHRYLRKCWVKIFSFSKYLKKIFTRNSKNSQGIPVEAKKLLEEESENIIEIKSTLGL